MAIIVHVARVALMPVDPTGNVIDKLAADTTNKIMLTASSEHRMIIDANIASTTNNPTVKTYLELEAAANFVMEYMDQNTVITYLRNATAGFPSS